MSREIQSCPNHQQRLALEALGFTLEKTDDPAFAHWCGHGLRFPLPAKMECDQAGAMRAVIGAARADGKREHQKACADAHDAWIGLMKGRPHK